MKRMDLAGEWRVALDKENEGIREKWFSLDLEECIQLPGTTDEARIGELTGERCTDRLSRTWRWIGPAWYQRTVTIPKDWRGKKIVMFLERTKDSQVWVDNTWAGSDDSLVTPHEFDLTKQLKPGKHRLTILVDNAKLPPVGPCHQVDERTQTNWNGIIGRMELYARGRVHPETVQVFPDLETNTLRVLTTVWNEGLSSAECKVSHKVEVVGREKEFRIRRQSATVRAAKGETQVDFIVKLPADIPRWDEFDRSVLRVIVDTDAVVRGKRVKDSCETTCGMRSFVAERGQFRINDRTCFLRGKNDCALFPLTGYAPMDKDEWIRLLSISKSYGLNHYRFHSWCPPEAAFAAADELGIYFQVELPNKMPVNAPENKDYMPPAEAYETLDELAGGTGQPAVRTAYLKREGERMLKYYGNHPSFVMMTLGNEIGGDVDLMKGMCDHFRAVDDRHLYAMGTNHFHWDIKQRDGDEFWVIKGTAPDNVIRGASWGAIGHIDNEPPSTTVDYCDQLHGVPIPVVGHEMAQFEVYPDFEEIRKYKGVLKANSFEIFRERLRDAGMLDQARDFHRASGKLSAICHREDVEAALRTKGFGGFQMLDLQDFSGQGVALVGLLDVFMESKGLIRPDKWRQACCETVPLLWMKKYAWTNAETFQGRIRVAHYGPADLNNQTISWELRAGRKRLASGTASVVDIPTGTVTEIDMICASLKSIKAAQKLELRLVMDGTKYQNSYDLWVYPAKVRTSAPKGITTARSFSRKVLKELEAGGKVLLFPKPERLKRSVKMAFQTGFWSPMFRKPGRDCPTGGETPGTQGTLCDPKHPLFERFPTEFHGNWQWWHLVKNSRAMILDDTPQDYRPTLQVVDGFDRNHKLGLICEARVGQGKLLICSIDLPSLQEHPEARQLLHCIQQYMASAAFKPENELVPSVIKKFV